MSHQTASDKSIYKQSQNLKTFTTNAEFKFNENDPAGFLRDEDGNVLQHDQSESHHLMLRRQSSVRKLPMHLISQMTPVV